MIYIKCTFTIYFGKNINIFYFPDNIYMLCGGFILYINYTNIQNYTFKFVRKNVLLYFKYRELFIKVGIRFVIKHDYLVVKHNRIKTC